MSNIFTNNCEHRRTRRFRSLIDSHRASEGLPAYKSNGKYNKYKKKSNYTLKSKNVKIPFNIPISQVKQHSVDSSAADLQLVPSTGSRIFSTQLTNITQGDVYNNRETNNIRLKRVIARFMCVNTATTSRCLRFAIVGLRGSQNSADTTTWTDLFMDPSTLAVQAANGMPPDGILKINRDEYTVLYDRKYRIAGTGDSGQPNYRIITINKVMNRLVQYAYNASTTRQGVLYLVVNAFEEPGTAAGASTVDCTYYVTTYFNDVRS